MDEEQSGERVMPHASLYVDFANEEDVAVDEPQADLPAPDDDQRSKAAYEKGYSSGWEDATAAAARRSDAVTSDLERAIQDMGFTYHEAVGQVRLEFSRFAEQLMKTFLPSLAAAGLRETLRAKIEEMAEPAAEVEVEIFVPPRFVGLFSQMEREDGVFPIRIVEEASLSESQAFARIGRVEWSIDFTELLSELESALAQLGEDHSDDSFEGARKHG